MNPALWVCRNNAITDAAKLRQLLFKTGAWVNSPGSLWQVEKMMPELSPKNILKP